LVEGVWYSFGMLDLEDTKEFQINNTEQLRDSTEIKDLPYGIGVVDGQEAGFYDDVQVLLAEIILNLQEKNEIRERLNQKSFDPNSVYFLISEMESEDQVAVFEVLLQNYPNICWFRGGNLNTATDVRRRVINRDGIPDDNNLIVLDAPFGVLGEPSQMAPLAMRGDNLQLRDWPGIYVVFLRDIVSGLKNGSIEVRTGHGNDLMIDFPHTKHEDVKTKTEKYYRWMKEVVVFYDVKDMSKDKGETENKSMNAQFSLVDKCIRVDDRDERIRRLREKLIR